METPEEVFLDTFWRDDQWIMHLDSVLCHEQFDTNAAAVTKELKVAFRNFAWAPFESVTEHEHQHVGVSAMR